MAELEAAVYGPSPDHREPGSPELACWKRRQEATLDMSLNMSRDPNGSPDNA